LQKENKVLVLGFYSHFMKQEWG